MPGKLLVCCEESQAITSAFRSLGYEAFSCDLQPCSGPYPQYHFQCDCFSLDFSEYDLIIAHPPCTYLTKAQPMKLFFNDPGRYKLLEDGRKFFLRFWELDHPHIVIENPIPFKMARLPAYSQIIQPYNFGEPYSKATCLWLKGVPPLMNSCIVPEYRSWVFTGSRTSIRRSKTFPGIARAMAQQWHFLLA